MNIADYKIIAIIVVAIAAIGILCFAPNIGSGDSDAEIDPVGSWYCVDKTTINGDGSVTVQTIENYSLMSNYDLAIYSIDEGMFYGMLMKCRVSGTISDNALYMGALINGVQHRACGSFINDNLLVINYKTVMFDNTNSVLSYGAFIATYTLDRSVPSERSVPDISGTWSSFSHKWYDGAVKEGAQLDATILQNGPLVEVTFEEGSTLESIKLTGSLYEDGSGVTVGYLIGSAGNSWEITYSGGVLTIAMATNVSSMGTVYMEFSRNGDSRSTSQIIDLTDTTWRAISNNSIDQYGNGVIYSSQYYIDFDSQDKNSFLGVFHRGVLEFGFAGFFFENSIERLIYTISYNDSSLIASYGWFNNDRLYISDTREYSDGSVVTTLVTYEMLDVKEEYDLVGHWYLTNIIGYNYSDEYVVHPNDLSSLMDLDVFSVKDDIFNGYSTGGAMTGSYIDGLITMCGDDYVYGGQYYTLGWLIDNNTMIINTVFSRDDGSTAAYMGQYTRDRGSAPFQDVNLDIVGEWFLVSGNVYDGEIHAIERNNLVITEYQHNTFIGSFDRSINGVITNLDFKGCVSAVTANGRAYGMLIDEVGSRWYVDMDNQSMNLKIADKSGHIILDGPMLAIECICAKGGADISISDNGDCPDLVGVWRSTSLDIVDETGGRDEGSATEYTLEVTSQDGVFAVGNGIQGRMHGTFSLVFGSNVLNNLAAIMASNYDSSGNSDAEFGFGWFNEVNGVMHMYMVETYKDGAGIWTTQITDMVKD